MAAFVIGCDGQPRAGPEDAVHAFFAAVDADDCAAASKWLDGVAKQRFQSEPCESALDALRRKRFDRILGSEVDGRDPAVHLVRVRFSSERTPALIGVRETRRGHRIVRF